MRIGDQVGVAILAVLGSLLIRKFGFPERLLSIFSLALSILIVWGFAGGSRSLWEALGNGTVSGLMAGGILYILLGIPRKREGP